jgi:polysaccharide pyruvyl transferase WcaK-like protein
MASVTGIPQFKCILWGGYASGNVGDELTLAVALKRMTARFGDSVAVLSSVPGYTKRLFPSVAVIPFEPILSRSAGATSRRLQRRILMAFTRRFVSQFDISDQFPSSGSETWADAIRRSELLYLVGGGYLTDLFWIDRVLLPIRVAKEFGIRIESAPIGIGPFSSHHLARLTADALSTAHVTVRDKTSAQFCTHYRLAHDRLPDDGFKARDILRLPEKRDSGNRHRPFIGVNIFEQHGSTKFKKSKAWWTSLLHYLSRANIGIKGFCFHNNLGLDLAATTECFSQAHLDVTDVEPPVLDLQNACAQLCQFDAIVSTRFHAIVVGNAIGIPTYAVYEGEYYSAKMQAAADGFAKCKLLPNFSEPAETVAAQIVDMLNSGKHTRAGIEPNRVPENSAEAAANLALGLVEQCHSADAMG